MMKISFSLEWFQSIWMNCLCIYSCSSCYRRRYWGHFFSIVIFFIIAISRWWMTMEKYLTSVTRLIEFFFSFFLFGDISFHINTTRKKKYRKWLFFAPRFHLIFVIVVVDDDRINWKISSWTTMPMKKHLTFFCEISHTHKWLFVIRNHSIVIHPLICFSFFFQS